MDDLLYDNFELELVGEYLQDGELICERLDAGKEDSEYIRTFWTIYGHLPTGGVEALIDTDDEEYAKEVFSFMQLLLETYKLVKKGKF